MNRAIPISTWLGGTCWSESARLIKSSTIAIRRKLVIRIKMLGASARAVKRRSSCMEKATSCPLSGFLMVRSIKGTGVIDGGSGMPIVPSVAIPGNGVL